MTKQFVIFQSRENGMHEDEQTLIESLGYTVHSLDTRILVIEDLNALKIASNTHTLITLGMSIDASVNSAGFTTYMVADYDQIIATLQLF